MVNRVVLVGRLTRDPELRKTDNEMSVASFTVAIDGRGKNPTTSFIPVTVWNQQAENVAKFTKKGSLVGVDGRLQQRKYERKDGTQASVIEVVADNVTFLEPKGDKTEGTVDEPNDYQPDETDTKNVDSLDITDDDIGF